MIWGQDQFIGTLMQFDTYFHDLVVVVSNVETDSPIFTTINDSMFLGLIGDVGSHPLHGHRKFSIKTSANEMYLYTMGADTLGLMEGLLIALGINVFEHGHNVWVHLFSTLNNFINAYGGRSVIVPPISERGIVA